MKELIPLLNEAARVYYNDDRELMSNLEYDRFYEELERLEKSSGVILAGSPTNQVGYTVLSSLEKVRHETPMLSLDKTKSIDKLKSFLADQRGLLSWKLDGLTIVLRYNKGVLQSALTRGNGEIGEDITHNARVFSNIPLSINYSEELILRGEAMISYADFDRINGKLPADEQYKNPRNLCSGTVRQLNSEIAADRRVSFFVFNIVSSIEKSNEIQDLKSKQFEWIKSLGFETVEYEIVHENSIEEFVSQFEDRISANKFPSDGLVLTYDSISYSRSLGTTSKFPKDSIAYKWADDLSETTLIDIQWNTSRTGLINPVAVFEPVEIEGTTVRQASLHNINILQNLELGIGDRILVYKANMIIPQIADNLTRSNTAEIPQKCPVCEEPTEIISENESKSLFCGNSMCKAQLVQSLTHFASRDAMNIEGLSEQTLEAFVQKTFVENFADLYSLDKFKNDIISMNGYGEKSYSKLSAALEKSKHTRLPNFIYALGIKHVGLNTAKLICDYYAYDIEKIMKAQQSELEEIEGVGKKISESVRRYFSNEANINLVKKLLSLMSFSVPEAADGEKPLADQRFVITGDLSIFQNRKEFQSLIESLGGKVTGSVTSKTTYLINNDAFSESLKNKKARELGVQVITEEEFADKLKAINSI
jgi:DNA ligase (NAD+)